MLEVNGRVYPPKHILSVVTGIEVNKFSGGNSTDRVFEQLGLTVRLKPLGEADIADLLEEVSQFVQETDLLEGLENMAITNSPTYTEGLRRLVSTYRYERDPQARNACIQHYGTQCDVCGFDFGEEFGAIGDGFIHVHHLTPISERDTEYIINPIKDLRPVCPNCHAMLHRRNPPYTVAELKELRRSASKHQ